MSKCVPCNKIVNHLGFQLNFKEGKLQVTPKNQNNKKSLGKIVKKEYNSKRQLAAILGQIRCNLMALPFFLKSFHGLHVPIFDQKLNSSLVF